MVDAYGRDVAVVVAEGSVQISSLLQEEKKTDKKNQKVVNRYVFTCVRVMLFVFPGYCLSPNTHTHMYG